MALLDGRIRLDAAVFWSDYSDYQTYGLAPNGISASLSALPQENRNELVHARVVKGDSGHQA